MRNSAPAVHGGRVPAAGAVALALALFASPVGALDLDVVGLFAGKAVVVIDGGTPRTLSAGQKTPEGVRLLRADSSSAEFEIEGRRQVLGLGRGRYGGGSGTASAMATLYADTSGHFVSDGSINGSTVRFLVDTGATTVALNSREAARIGLDYRRGERILMSTANGVVNAFSARLDTVRVGGIELHNVEAVVHEGDHPSIVLIGMSFLNQVDMKRDGALMTLTRRF
jgi:aspartyl protease family protein